MKNDTRDAEDLADPLRLGRLAEAWVAPPEVRELRELVRYRAKLTALRSGLKAQVHAVLAKEGLAVSVSDLFGVAGQRLLDSAAHVAEAYRVRVESLRDLLEVYTKRSSWSTASWPASSTSTGAGRPSRPFRAWAPSLPRCSWPRWAT